MPRRKSKSARTRQERPRQPSANLETPATVIKTPTPVLESPDISLQVSGIPTNPSTQHTKQNSPFFKIPPELRNNIYHLVLGGHTLHANLHPGPYWLYICQATSTEEEAFKQCKATGIAPDWFGHDGQHGACEPAVQYIPLELSLLRTCRQIYQEASLVPFAANAFIVRDTKRLARLCERLSPAQKNAIQDLEYVSTEPSRPPKEMEFSSFRFREFSELRRLKVRLEFSPVVPAREGEVLGWSTFLKQFRQRKLESVTVIAYHRGGYPVADWTRNWVEQRERELLNTPEEVSEEGKAINVKRERQRKKAEARWSRELRALRG